MYSLKECTDFANFSLFDSWFQSMAPITLNLFFSEIICSFKEVSDLLH